MPSQEDILHQQTLLQDYRRTLFHYLSQRAQLSTAYAPPGVSQGIHEARENIRRIKAVLRNWGIAVEDLPDDETDFAITEQQRSRVTVDKIREVLALCYRRAVFTRFHAQLSAEAMFASLAECRSNLQRLVVFIEPENLQKMVATIISELDYIERNRTRVENINAAKVHIIGLLLQLSRAAAIPFALPPSVTEEVFFTQAEADAAPNIQPTNS
jgi:hypothetical protein